MTNRIKCLLVLTFLVNGLFAQKYADFSFMDESKFNLTPEQKEETESVIEKIYSVEYVINQNEEIQYTYIRSAKWINSDDAIKDNNKIYVSARENSEYIYQKARVILPDGKITELKEEDIKEGVYGENDEERKYYYYALEGLEKGSIIESVSYKKTYPNYYGSLVYLQEDISRYKQTFELICPGHLVFAFKSINGAPEVVYDTTQKEQRRWTVEIDSMPKILDQPSFFDNAVKQSIIYKLDRNTARGRGDITSYSSAASNIYENLHPELDKKTQKSIDKIFKELSIKDTQSEKEKITAIENYVKSQYQIITANYEQLSDLSFVLANKTGSEEGITTLLLQFFKKAGVKYEVVVTCDRSDFRFHEDFEAYLFLSKYLVYFPKIKEYISPSEKYLRGRFVPDILTNNYGLFIKEMTVGELKTAVGKIKFIDALPYEDTKDVMDIEVDFSENQTMPKVEIKKTSSGYSAQYVQPYLHIMDDEAIENMKDGLAESIHEQLEFEEMTLVNTEANDFGTKPFIFELSSTKHAFVERAGNDLLFKIGDLIGPQVEMYQENERQFDVESNHNRYYERTILFDVPEGYKLKNEETMNFAYKYGEKGKEDLFFESTITKEGDKFKVFCVEYYADIIVSKERFEDYKTVINAAADFNKKVLVLEKL